MTGYVTAQGLNNSFTSRNVQLPSAPSCGSTLRSRRGVGVGLVLHEDVIKELGMFSFVSNDLVVLLGRCLEKKNVRVFNEAPSRTRHEEKPWGAGGSR